MLGFPAFLYRKGRQGELFASLTIRKPKMEGSVLLGYSEVQPLRAKNSFLKVMDCTMLGADYRRSAIIREHSCQRMTQGLSKRAGKKFRSKHIPEIIGGAYPSWKHETDRRGFRENLKFFGRVCICSVHSVSCGKLRAKRRSGGCTQTHLVPSKQLRGARSG